ncbi:ABC transporter permease, partial [Chloroflexota bacterium]
LSFKIAVRFLKSGKTQTILIVVGMAIAISIQVFVGLLLGSLQKGLVNQTIGNSPQITITSATDIGTIRDWEKMVSIIESLGSTKAVSVSVSTNGFVRNGSANMPVLIRGFDLERADRIYNINNRIYEGSQIETSRDVLIGKDLREELEANLGDRITVSSPDGSISTFTIAGFYDLGVASINKSWVIASLETTQQIFGFDRRITSIEMTVDDVFEVNTIASQIEQELDNEDINVENWKEQNEDLLSALNGQQTSSTIIQAVIILSVVIAITSVLAINVLQKSRQIGILKAMGIKNLTASMIFIYQGLLIGLVGSILGMSLGLGLLYAFSTFTANPDGTALIELYIEYDFIIRSWIIAILASTLAGVIPASKSLRLNPIEVIREG